jgi:hypothetical protein
MTSEGMTSEVNSFRSEHSSIQDSADTSATQTVGTNVNLEFDEPWGFEDPSTVVDDAGVQHIQEEAARMRSRCEGQPQITFGAVRWPTQPPSRDTG